MYDLPYKLLDWVSKDKLDWCWLSKNPNAITLLEKNPDKIYWRRLSYNPNAIHLLEKNINKIDWKIDWYWLSRNPNAISLLEQNPDKIDWESLSANSNAIPLLEQNMDKITWWRLSMNPNIFRLDYDKMRERFYNTGIPEELMQRVWHPNRMSQWPEEMDLD